VASVAYVAPRARERCESSPVADSDECNGLVGIPIAARYDRSTPIPHTTARQLVPAQSQYLGVATLLKRFRVTFVLTGLALIEDARYLLQQLFLPLRYLPWVDLVLAGDLTGCLDPCYCFQGNSGLQIAAVLSSLAHVCFRFAVRGLRMKTE
jgi:hypothetical protein